jgi:two-component system, cell cycle sensor histidine kinase and response regulator CckA
LDYSRGSETILLVEDEEPLRKLCTEFLEQLGYRMLAASNAKEAVALVEGYSGKIDLLITDVVMPGLPGPELAEALLALRPDLKVIFISGYAEGSLAPNGILKPGTVLVNKPFTIRALTAKLREVLGTA